MKLNSVLTYLIGKLSELENTCEGERFLRSKGFTFIGRGCESIVFSRDGFEYVIKLMFDSHYNSDGKHYLLIPSDKHFVDTALIEGEHFPIVIQSKVTCCDKSWNNVPMMRKLRKFENFIGKKWSNINDLGDWNIGIDRFGKFKIFDWSDKNFSNPNS